MTSLEPNKERVKQRREDVMKRALRARDFPEEELTKEISNFMRFTLSLRKIKIQWESDGGK